MDNNIFEINISDIFVFPLDGKRIHIICHHIYLELNKICNHIDDDDNWHDVNCLSSRFHTVSLYVIEKLNLSECMNNDLYSSYISEFFNLMEQLIELHEIIKLK